MGAQWKCYFPDYDVRAAPPNSYSSLFTLHHICQLAPLFPVKHHTLVQKRKVWFIDSHALGKQADIPCECTQRKGDPRGGRVVRETWFHHGEQQSWQRSACRWRQTAALRFPLQKKSRLVQYTEAGDRIYRSSSKPDRPTDSWTNKAPTCRPAFVKADPGLSPKERQSQYKCAVVGHDEAVFPGALSVSVLLPGQR